MKDYTQLTQEERYQIYEMKTAGNTPAKIAKALERDPSTIYRELKRNTGQRGYRPHQAQTFAFERRQRKLRPRICAEVWRAVEILLRRDWSPEQVAGRLALEQGISISHERIYQHVYADKARGGDLHSHLRCRKQRRKRYGTYSRRGRISGQISIDERPAEVETRERLGDWEGDTIIGAGHGGTLVSAVERKSAFTILSPAIRKTAQAVRHALRKEMGPMPDKLLTMTVDHGREWSDHQGIARDLDVEVYFAHPYASWERGLNENTNGLIRQYFPKSMDLKKVSRAETQRVMKRLNHRPRKGLDYRTPYEVFYETATSLTVALTS